MDNAALAELLKQAELALLAFSTADKHLEQVEFFYLDSNASSIQMAKLCVEAAGAPLFKIVTRLHEILGMDLACIERGYLVPLVPAKAMSTNAGCDRSSSMSRAAVSVKVSDIQ